eukprot:15465803-Alexandrium_andersonii.AAC.1
MSASLVGSEMCIRDSLRTGSWAGRFGKADRRFLLEWALLFFCFRFWPKSEDKKGNFFFCSAAAAAVGSAVAAAVAGSELCDACQGGTSSPHSPLALADSSTEELDIGSAADAAAAVAASVGAAGIAVGSAVASAAAAVGAAAVASADASAAAVGAAAGAAAAVGEDAGAAAS